MSTRLSRLVVVERVTRELFEHHRARLANADACCAATALEEPAALRALADDHWTAGDAALYDGVERDLARFSEDAAVCQEWPDRPLSFIERCAIAAGLEARCRPVLQSIALVRRSAEMLGVPLGRIDATVIADDPYFRAAYADSRVLRGAFGRVRLYRAARSSLLTPLRERLTASRWRPLLQHRGGPSVAPPASTSKRVGLFVLPGRSPRMFAPVGDELRRRGWSVDVFAYASLPDAGAIPFDHAARGPGRPITFPEWRWADTLADAGVNAAIGRRALASTWAAFDTFRQQHRRVLERWRPSVAITYGSDVLALSLLAAAKDLDVPTLFMPHGVMPPEPYMHYFAADATAAFGQACIDVNVAGAWRHHVRGRLMVTGAPHYDALREQHVARTVSDVGRRLQPPPDAAPAALSGLRRGASRPFTVVFFATYGSTLFTHSLQSRSLRMIAEALPSDCFLVCKLHPSREERESCKAVLASCLSTDAFQVVGEREYTTADLLASSDVAVAVSRSMSLVDAVVAGCPPVAIVMPDLPPGTSDTNHPAKTFASVGRVANSVSDLHEAVRLLTRDDAARQRALAMRDEYVTQYLGADGHSAERVASLIEELSARLGGSQDPPLRGTTRAVASGATHERIA